MAAGNSSKVIRATGRLVVGPTMPMRGANACPYGGTEIGKANACVLLPLGAQYLVESEGLGEVTDVLEGNQRWVFSCFLRGWDRDAVRLLHPDGYEEGAQTQHARFEAPGVAVPGSSALGRAVVLAFVPDDAVHVPGVVLYRAVPDWSDGAELAFQRGTELGIPLSFDCLRDASGRILQMGLIADLDLP